MLNTDSRNPDAVTAFSGCSTVRELLDEVEDVLCRQTATESTKTIAILSAVVRAIKYG